mmetsp:Transcript_16284/g.56920  ORF Transcript_16284/g.56920 Transcript_16284/m.56920 type:complete len:227 (-) Transcript_16284:1232-1912(-)
MNRPWQPARPLCHPRHGETAPRRLREPLTRSRRPEATDSPRVQPRGASAAAAQQSPCDRCRTARCARHNTPCASQGRGSARRSRTSRTAPCAARTRTADASSAGLVASRGRTRTRPACASHPRASPSRRFASPRRSLDTCSCFVGRTRRASRSSVPARTACSCRIAPCPAQGPTCHPSPRCQHQQLQTIPRPTSSPTACTLRLAPALRRPRQQRARRRESCRPQYP